jgi:hypothetical protein
MWPISEATAEANSVSGMLRPSAFAAAILKVAWRRASFDFPGFEPFRGDREGGEGFEADRP